MIFPSLFNQKVLVQNQLGEGLKLNHWSNRPDNRLDKKSKISVIKITPFQFQFGDNLTESINGLVFVRLIGICTFPSIEGIKHFRSGVPGRDRLLGTRTVILSVCCHQTGCDRSVLVRGFSSYSRSSLSK